MASQTNDFVKRLHSPASASKARGLLCNNVLVHLCIYQTPPSHRFKLHTSTFVFFLFFFCSPHRCSHIHLIVLCRMFVGNETIRINFNVRLIAHQKRNIGNILYMFLTHLLFSNNFSVPPFHHIRPLARAHSHRCHFHNV